MNPFGGMVILLLLGRGWPGAAPPHRLSAIHTMHPGLAAALIGGLSAAPSTVTFSLTDPDAGPVSGTPVTVTWSALLGAPINTWTLKVQASASAFTSCSTVPVSAVTVTCASASATGLGGSGTCAGGFTLSTSPQLTASGAEGTLSGNYTVHLSFKLADSWRYIASLAPACTLTLTYTASTP
jgi:hypothetical protein